MGIYDIDTSVIVDFENDTVNSPDDMDTTINEIVSKFNAMIDEVTGHYHDGTNSRAIFGSLGNYSLSEFAKAQIMGMFT